MVLNLKSFLFQTKIPSLECVICETKCENRFSLRVHMRRHHHEKKLRNRFECKICCKSFASKCGLDRHFYVSHVEDQTGSHPCSVCGKIFEAKSRLKNHLHRQHFNRKSYSCLECPKVYASKFNFVRHISFGH